MDDLVPVEAFDHIMAISNLDREINEDFPLDMLQIRHAQAKDTVLLKHIQIANINIDGQLVTTINDRVWVPKELQQRIVTWYHDNLQHAGVTRMVNTIGQTFAWKGLRTMVEKHVASCDSCQCNKQSNKKPYGKIPLTPALRNKGPWEKVQVDCCGPWTIRYKNEVTGRISNFSIHLLSMVDVCNGWPEFARIPSANSIATSKAFDKNWLCWYPCPKECGHDNGKEFMGIEFQEMLASRASRRWSRTRRRTQLSNASKVFLENNFGRRSSRTIGRMTWIHLSNPAPTQFARRHLPTSHTHHRNTLLGVT